MNKKYNFFYVSNCWVLVLFLCGFSVSFAHHSGNMFDREQTVELTGTVKEFQWTSPHIWIQVLVSAEDDIIEEWSIEGGVPNRLFRSGWRPTSFEPGDRVKIVAYPMRDGAKAGLFIGAKFIDGSTLGRFPE